MKKIFLLIALFSIMACSSHPSNYAKLETVDYVDLEQYTGTWFEIARMDNWFQKDCVRSQATYNLRNDGDVEVINKCITDPETGEYKEAKGRAWLASNESTSKLKVQFPLSNVVKLPFLSGDYWIIELDADYNYVMVGEKKRESLWILSRDKTMTESKLSELVEKARNKGFPVDELIYQGV